MFQIVRTYVKIGGGELYEDVMGLIDVSATHKAFKEEKEGFVGTRGYLSPDGKEFVVKETWETEAHKDTWFNSDPVRRLENRNKIDQYLTEKNLVETKTSIELP
jgi:heme-degrading monooxygenase HmoA